MNRKNQAQGNIMLLVTALVWGVAFVAQSVSMEYIGPFTFTGVRMILGGIVLIPCIYILDKLSKDKPKERDKKVELIGGIICGLILLSATMFQQFGILSTSVGKTGFITALYIIIVPILGIFFKRKPRPIIWVSALIAVVGMYMLCVNEGFSIESGDILVFICAILFSIHILVIDYVSPKVDGVRLSCIQFLTAGIISSVLMFIFEEPTVASIIDARVPILYAGIMSCGVAYTFQILGQQKSNPFTASLILSLESVISVLAGWVILGEALSVKELIGCGLVFVGIILAQLPGKKDESAQSE